MPMRFHPSPLSAVRSNPIPVGSSYRIYSILFKGKEYYVLQETAQYGIPIAALRYVLYVNDGYVYDTAAYTWQSPSFTERDLRIQTGDAALAREVLNFALANLSGGEKEFAQMLLNAMSAPGAQVMPTPGPTTSPAPTADLTTPPGTPQEPHRAQEPPKPPITDQVWFYPAVAGGIVLVSLGTIYLLTRRRRAGVTAPGV